MKRRKFIGTILGASAAVVVAPQVFAKTKTYPGLNREPFTIEFDGKTFAPQSKLSPLFYDSLYNGDIIYGVNEIGMPVQFYTVGVDSGIKIFFSISEKKLYTRYTLPEEMYAVLENEWKGYMSISKARQKGRSQTNADYVAKQLINQIK